MPHPKVKISDDSGNTATVTSERLDVNAYLNATPTIDIGDVSLLLGGTAASTDTGAVGAQTLRITLANDDYQFGAHDDAASQTGSVNSKLRYIASQTQQTVSYLGTMDVDSGYISTFTGGVYFSTYVDDTDWTDDTSRHMLVGGVRNDTPNNITDGNTGPLAVNSSGHVLIDVVDGGQLDTIIDTLETTLTAIETDQAAIETLLTGIDADTDAIKTAVEILDDWDDSNYANINLNLAGSDAPTGGGAESGALRVTLANDSTGVISIDDGGNTITVDGTVTANLSTTDNAVLDAMVVDLAAIEVLLTGIDADTNIMQGRINNVTYTDDANWTDDASQHLLVGGLYQSSMQSVTDGDVAPFQVDANGVLKVSPSTGSEFQVDVVAALPAGTNAIGKVGHDITGLQSDNNEGVDDTTAEALGASQACKRVDMQADSSNTGYIYVGGSDVSATKGIRLSPGDFYSIDIDNVADIFVLASVDEEDIHFTYYT